MKNLAAKFWREWVRPFALVFLIVAPFKSAVADWNWVPTGSMKPTILEGELVFVNKLAYDFKVPFTTRHLSSWGDPERGDVVVFYSPNGTRLVKRVIGLPGDTIELRNEKLWINGMAQSYSAQDASPFQHEVFEDQHPVIAVEHLAGRDSQVNHYVMALPGRRALRSFGPLVVPQGQYFMMGDSRDNSADSRFIGTIARAQVIGRVSRVVFSFDPTRYFTPRPRRFFQPLTVSEG